MSNPVPSSRLERFVSIWKTLTASLPLEAALQALAETAATVLDCEGCSILLYDEQQHVLRFVAAPKEQLAVMKNLGVPLERSVAGWVFTHARPAQLNQAGGDERIFRVVDREVSDETHSLLAVPVMYRGKTIGVFEAINKTGRSYGEEDLMLLELLAAHAAVSIHNEREIEAARAAARLQKLEEKLRRDRLAILVQEQREAARAVVDGVDAARHPQPRGGAREVPWAMDDPDPFPGADAILDACTRLEAIAEQMTHLHDTAALRGAPRYEIVRAKPLAERVVEIFVPKAAARNIALLVDLPKDLTCRCDPAQIGLALYNLVENACRFNTQDGWVRVRAEKLHGFTKFAIIDRGVGLSEKEQVALFDPAAQTGLGLAIAKEMIDLHGGELWVESEEGQGSTFAFLLPDDEEP